MRKIRNVLCLVFSLMMLLGMSTTAFASEDSASSVPTLSKEGIAANTEDNSVSPLLWPGDGPAPQVTSVAVYDYGWLENGNFGVVLKVYGYGNDTTYFSGREVDWFRSDPFIISGTGADGFYYWYDCGSITSAGTYSFQSTFRSLNFPYGQKSLNTSFTFS